LATLRKPIQKFLKISWKKKKTWVSSYKEIVFWQIKKLIGKGSGFWRMGKFFKVQTQIRPLLNRQERKQHFFPARILLRENFTGRWCFGTLVVDFGTDVKLLRKRELRLKANDKHYGSWFSANLQKVWLPIILLLRLECSSTRRGKLLFWMSFHPW